MKTGFKTWLGEELRNLRRIEKSTRPAAIPLLAALSAGIPLFAGYFLHQQAAGLLVSTGGLIILYYTEEKLSRKILWMLSCSFGFILSFAAGLFLGSTPFLSCFILAFFAFVVNLLLNHVGMKPPGAFLFIIITAVAICMPHDVHKIPLKVFLLAIGCLLSCFLVLLHHLFFRPVHPGIIEHPAKKPLNRNVIESAVLALSVGTSLGIGYGFGLNKPYWIPISCAAIMQGINVRHIWQRGFQRLCGTILGLGIAWLILSYRFTFLEMCIAITLLQFAATFFIARHYALVTLFFTPVAIFLAEAGSALQADPDQLIRARLLDTILGCAIGILCGWILHDLFLRKKTFPPDHSS